LHSDLSIIERLAGTELEHRNSALESVEVGVATLQVSVTTARVLERGTRVQDPSVVEDDAVAGFESKLEHEFGAL
jgi:hypothetical protein